MIGIDAKKNLLYGGPLIIVFLLHFTIIQFFIPDLTNLYYLVLAVCLILICQQNRVTTSLFPLLIASLFSLMLSTDLLPDTLGRWIIWLLVIIVTAPIILNKDLIYFRNFCWWAIMYAFVVISCISFIWILLKLPNFGVSERFLGDGKYFRNGITPHEMILAPIAALSGIFLIYILFYSSIDKLKKWLCVFLVFICIGTMLMASSRSALVGFVLITITVIIDRLSFINKIIKKKLGLVVVIILATIPITIILPSYLNQFIENNSRLESKGASNSREGLWSARIADLNVNPLTGAGFHSVSKYVIRTQSFTGVNSQTGRTEFGSLYLQALSTMGVLGFIAFIYFLGKILRKALHHSKEKNAKLYLFIYLFLLFHSIAESYAFSAGAMLCIFFWLTTSQIFNLKYYNTIK